MSSTAAAVLVSDHPDHAHRPGWQEILQDLITDPDELLRMLGLRPDQLPVSREAMQDFTFRVPRPFAARMRPGEPDDPLLLQVLPVDKERDDTPGFAADPLREAQFNPQPGLLHKYHGRALLMAAPHCAVHCRYCFRRHFPYEENTPGRRDWEAALEHLAADRSIEEVIYSGGDPLAASDRQLAWLTRRIEAIPHIRRLRLHSRTPIMIPQRVDRTLLEWLGESRLQTVMVVHANHANEIDEDVDRAMRALREAGVTLLNQSVMLRGINDDVASLAALSEKLFSVHVLPYYMHVLDKVQGVAHFDVPEPRAKALMKRLRNRLPGYLVPGLVREIPGEGAKTVLL